VHERALARTGHARDDDQHAEGDVDVDVLEVVGGGAADLEPAGRRPHRVLEGGRGRRGGGPVRVPLARVRPDRTLEADLPTRGARTGSRSTTWSGDPDHLGLCSTNEHGVALVPEAPEQGVHPLDVVGCMPTVGS